MDSGAAGGAAAAAAASTMRQWRIDHWGRIPKQPYKITVGLFFGLAVAVTLCRAFMRIYNRTRLSVDDGLVFFGVMCLAIATGLLYCFVDALLLTMAINSGDVLPTAADLSNLSMLVKLSKIYLNFIWTAIYAIKFAFLALFYRLIDRLSPALTRFFWLTVVMTSLSWVLAIVGPYILCPYFDPAVVATKCYPNYPHSIYIGLGLSISAVDVVTDFFITAIPIVILYMSSMDLASKFTTATILCLSLVMAILALIRMIGNLHPTILSRHDFDTAWGIFWNQIEASIAIIMASVAILRNLLTHLGTTTKSSGKKHSGNHMKLLGSFQQISLSGPYNQASHNGALFGHSREYGAREMATPAVALVKMPSQKDSAISGTNHEI